MQTHVMLAPYTTMKIGGPADFFLTTSDEKVIITVLRHLTTEKKIPYFIIGGGSNVVFDDKGFRGAVIKVVGGSYHIEKKGSSAIVTFSAGYLAHLAAQKMISEKLSGLESFFGLPGTVGGAVVMNSKWPKDSFSTGDSFIDGIYITPQGERKMVKKSDLSFSYGFSSLQNEHGVLISARFLLNSAPEEVIRKQCDRVLQYRKMTQPFGVFSSGCVFKNCSDEEQQDAHVPTKSAGYLIDKCGLKGYTCGGLSVSTVHANFFINNGTATSKDFDTLTSHVASVVKNTFGIELHREVLRVLP